MKINTIEMPSFIPNDNSLVVGMESIIHINVSKILPLIVIKESMRDHGQDQASYIITYKLEIF